MIARIAALAVLALVGSARADAPGQTRAAAAQPRELAPAPDPDPAVEEASDANLESTATRSGMVFAGSIGGGMIVGLGVHDAAGRGGAVALRLGHVATPHTVITLGVDLTFALHGVKDQPVHTNSDTGLFVGAQYYLNPSLWLRFGGGLGIYLGHQVQVEVSNMPGLGDLTLVGPAALAGIGVDIVRFKSAVLGLEASTSAMINSQGVLLASHLNLGLAFD